MSRAERHRAAALILVTLAGLTAGCSASTASDGSANDLPALTALTRTPTQSATASPISTTNAHGNLVKRVGQDAGITIDGVAAADWVVTKIEVDPTCHNRYAEKPANGHYVVLTLKVTTTSALVNDDGTPGSVTFNPGIWSGYDADGTTMNDILGNASTCLTDAEQLPDDIGPGQTAKGEVAFDVTTTTGSLELPQLVGPGGWEYAYGG
jgi:hypothetical protein